MSVEETVHGVTLAIVQRRTDIQSLNNDQKLIEDLGLTSMDLAELIATLDVDLEVEPFAADDADITSVNTVGKLCKIYQKHLDA